jgi:thymidylate kinase
MLITFSGLDGAGKSTLIAGLRAALEKQNRRVAVFHMNDHVGLYAYLRFLRDRVRVGLCPADGGPAHSAGSPDGCPTPARQGWLRRLASRLRNAILWSKLLRRCIYPLDLLIFLCYRLYIEKVRKQVLIMDRYFYDTLVDVDGRGWFWLRCLSRITPTPAVPVYLDISPEESFARKGEYSVDYLRRRWESYRKVFPWVRGAVVLATNTDVDASLRTLERVVSERMAAR